MVSVSVTVVVFVEVVISGTIMVVLVVVELTISEVGACPCFGPFNIMEENIFELRLKWSLGG